MKYLITYAGFEYNDNGADFYPDAYTTFEGTPEELLVYLEKKELEHQTHVALWEGYKPSWQGGRRATVEALPATVWDKTDYDAVNDTAWLRDVVEVREVPGIPVNEIIQRARALGVEAARLRVEKAKALVAQDDLQKAAQQAAQDRDLYVRLSRRFAEYEEEKS